MQTVYVLEGHQGKWSDHYSWVEGVFATIDGAQAAAHAYREQDCEYRHEVGEWEQSDLHSELFLLARATPIDLETGERAEYEDPIMWLIFPTEVKP